MRVVFDLDDTISVHKNRDYENASPINETISKIRELKKDGAEIIIYSSRGQNSCKGDLKLIEERNREQIERWLKRYDVPYDSLVFGKPLADVYVDDKGVSLKDFLEKDYGPLEGNSGAEVFRAGDRVIKRGKTVREEADWYRQAREIGLNVPDVNSVVLETIDMEYIDGIPGNKKELQSRDLELVISQIVYMGMYRAEESFDVGGYIHFTKDRLKIAGWGERFPKLISYIMEHDDEIRSRTSFSHGDLSLSNIIFTAGVVYLIDPSPRRQFSSFLNDFAKLRFSLDGGEQLLHGGSRPSEYSLRLSELSKLLSDNGWLGIVKAMEAVHWIRMLKYFTGKDQIIWNKAKELEESL